MQKRRKTTALRTALTLLIFGGMTLLLVGCNPSGVGIFYRLQNETKTQTLSNLPDTVTVASMALASSVNAYYIGTGQIYAADRNNTSPTATLTWNAVSPPSGIDSSTAFCNQFVVDGSTIYAIYSDNTSAPYLYEAPITSSSLTNLKWTPVSGFGPGNSGGFNAQTVFFINGQLLVSVQYNGDEYALYPMTNATTPLVSGLTSPITSAAFDSTDSRYWFISGSFLYTSTAPLTTTSLSQVANAPSLGTDISYRSAYWSSILDTLFLSTSGGSVYALKGSWSSSSTFYDIASWPSSISTKSGLWGFDELSLSSTKDVLMIGSDTGYYVMDIDPTTFSVTSSTSITLGQPGNTTFDTATVNYLSTTLATTDILGFYTDSGANRIFALTGLGLWRSVPISGGREWQQG